MRLIALILSIMLVIPAWGQRKKKGDEEEFVTYTEGITYSLPRKVLHIEVSAVREFFEPGPYASYSDQLLGIKDAKTRQSVKWIISDIDVLSFSEPDPENVFKALGEGAYNVSLAPNGCLAGINCDIDEYNDVSAGLNLFLEKVKREDGFSFADFNDTPLYIEGDSTNNYHPIRVSNDSKAAEAAARIMECRMSRFHVAAGLLDEFHPDGEAYRVSLDELSRIEKNYLTLFVGRTTYSTEKFSFDFIPSSTSVKGDVVFRFSGDKGVLPASDLSGKPVIIKVDPEKELINKYAKMASSENPLAGESGLFYKMPAMANVTIVYELKTIASRRMLIPQFGKTAPIPEGLLTGDYKIKIHPGTGAIKSVIKK